MRVTALLLVTIAAVIAVSAGAKVADANHGWVMPFDTFQPRGWDKFGDANRLLKSKCRPTFKSMEEFAHKSLADVLPTWRHTKLDRLKAKKERISEKSSLCTPWPDWWYRGALCIHSKEGAWNDPNAPYWGGMQMDISFQTTYGPEFYRVKGTADHWTPYEQLLASWRAYKSGRGWTPWPNTARYCGLL